MATMVNENFKMNMDLSKQGAALHPLGAHVPPDPCITLRANALAKESIEGPNNSLANAQAFALMGGSGGPWPPDGGLGGGAPHCSKPTSTDFESGIYCGYEVSVLAAEFWQNLDEKTRKYLLWDVPYMARRDTLRQCWHNADCICLAWTGPNKLRLSAAAWITRIGPGSKCGMAHVCFARDARPLAVEIGRAMLDGIIDKTPFYSLIGLVPAPFRHAIVYARRLGFITASARLNYACPMNGRVVDGILLTMNLKNI